MTKIPHANRPGEFSNNDPDGDTFGMRKVIRVQIPAYTDHWMKGDRYGELVKTSQQKATGVGRMLLSNAGGMLDIAHVKLDKSGKTVSVLMDDCEVIL